MRAVPFIATIGAAFVLAGCESVTPAVVSATPLQIEEGASATMNLETRGCSPAFDIDRGTIAPADAALHIETSADAIAAARLGMDRFVVEIPPTLAPGRHSFALWLTDGRVATTSELLEIVPTVPVVRAVTSPRTVLSFSERSIPFSVEITNPSACAVNSLGIQPVFVQSGATLALPVHGPQSISLAGGTTATVPFSVDLDSSVSEGRIVVRVRTTPGTRSGTPSCTGSVDARIDADDLVWTVVPASRQTLTVTSVVSRNRSVRGNGQAVFEVTVRNDASLDLTIESLTSRSTPAGFDGPVANLVPRTLAPGESHAFNAVLDAPMVDVTTSFEVSFDATARDTDGMLYSSGDSTASDMVTVDQQH